MYQNLFIHLSVNEHLGCFHLPAIVNSTAMNFGVAVVQLLSYGQLFTNPWTSALQASLSFTVSQSLLKLMLSQWCHPNISSLVAPFFSCPWSFQASGSFPMSQLFASGSQSIGASALASVLPVNILDWFPLWLTGLISLQSKGLSRVFSNTTVQKHQFFKAPPCFWYNSHLYMTTGKNHSFGYMNLCWQSGCLCFLIHCLGLS